MELENLSTINAKMKTIKEAMFSAEIDPYSLVSASAYDTAWVAMIPNPQQPSKPMFEGCLDWILKNQNQQLGFWGDSDAQSKPTVECLVATLACVVALKKWNLGSLMINKGLAYIHSSDSEKLLKQLKDGYECPRWFAIVFPGMVELAREALSDDHKIELEEVIVSNIFLQRQRILETEQLDDECHYPPLLSYLEALPSSYDFDVEDIIKKLGDEGSLFQSPSATARAFMATWNSNCLRYLQSLVQRFSHINGGVPTTYPLDEDLIKLSTINHVQRLGLAEHLKLETEQVLEQAYKNYKIIEDQESGTEPCYSAIALQLQLLKDSLAFRLLRMHGYRVLPWNVSWFLYNEEVRNLIEKNYEYFSFVMLNIYRATDLAFPREFELQEARTFSRNLLEKSISTGSGVLQNPFRRLIEHELSLPWIARLDHLEHRIWIEENETNALWRGKTSLQRLSGLLNDKLVDLAVQNYEFKQSIYKTELDQLKRWSKDWGLSDMGFGREKTSYCYFAVAANCPSLPYDSDVRMIAAKSGIIITIADDFFDMKGSDLNELRTLTDAVGRWDSKGLHGHSLIIFDALDNLVSETVTKYLEREGSDITSSLRDIWYETFLSWLRESEWSKSDSMPSMDEYLQNGMISIAAHTIVLPVSCFLKPSLPNSKLRPLHYETITKLVMVISRLLNDMQSYQKEEYEGIPNSVLLYLKKNEVNMEEAIAFLRDEILKKKEELIEHVLMDGFSNLPRECRLLHLFCLKTFQMFFNCSNRYDSDTEMLDDIGKAIYVPLGVGLNKKPLTSLPSESMVVKKCSSAINKYHHHYCSQRPFIHLAIKSRLSKNRLSVPTLSVGNWKTTTIPPKFNFRFI